MRHNLGHPNTYTKHSNHSCTKSLPVFFKLFGGKPWTEELNLKASWLGLTERDLPILQFSFSL